MKIGIGIDTGGTYTDAVVYDFQNGSVLGSAKSLTTKEDLTIGILGALDGLPGDLLSKAEFVSLSTTLATNACVEDKGGKAKLIFFGGDRKVIAENGGKYGLPDVDEIYIQESYTDFWGGKEREPDWELFSENIKKEFNDLDGAGIIEMNAMKNGAIVEKKAKKIFTQKHDIPVVCSHELFSELNCLQRGSSTLLNAGLFPVIKEFLDAIKIAIKKRGINASVVIVRSDGSLMSEEFASVRPVETLLCGPAASVIGSTRLSSESNCVVIDMGGTTTDIALVRNNIPVTAIDGISIGKWKTFVNGLYVKTFGLGGDSAIHHGETGLILEDYRVVPLCIAAEKYPVIADNLRKLLAGIENRHMKYLHEHYILIKDITGSSRYTDEEKRFCDALKDNPLILKAAAAAVGKDIYTLNISRLLKEGIVQMCGLTPTDIMHIKKDFSRYCDSIEASILGAKFVAFNLDVSVDELCDMAYDEIKRKIYLNVVKVMLENNDLYYMKNGVSKEIERFINESYQTAKSGKKDNIVSSIFKTDFSLVGIGAPIHIFLDDVAKMLGTKAVVPKYAGVANALGAVAGNICANYTVEIKPNYSSGGITGYTVFGGNVKTFEKLEEAEEFAISEAKEIAYEEAVKRGAQGEITVTCELNTNKALGKNVAVHLNTFAVAQAVGSGGFGNALS
ncbi:MAG: hydantoinase/oxoprolinase family protein [Oscillospiraceae bacterium]|nr:hydantoinase/oxoprolinase family protein [Oscillospiraceae bacterium]